MKTATKISKLTRRRDETGFTMLELLIAGAVLAILILMVFGIVSSSAGVHDWGMVTLRSQSTASNLIGMVCTELSRARLLSVEVGEAQCRISFQVPVDWDGDGDLLDSNGELEWGALDQLGWTCTLTFEQARTVSEVVDNEDYNHDGDRVDVFALGHLSKKYTDPSGAVQHTIDIMPDMIVVRYDHLGGDVDGDGVDDPMFRRVDAAGVENVDGSNVEVAIWILANRGRGRASLAKGSSTIHLRNFELGGSGS